MGPEEKDKESRAERKMEMEKEEFTEKQSFLGGNSRVSESDSREKWRPRHRQETHSGGPSFRAAPGFGLDRGRSETLHAAFSAGRGRGSPLASLPQLRPSSASPIGAVPLRRVDVDSGKPGLLADMFRYPRGDISEGKITGSGVLYSTSREQNAPIISGEIGKDLEDKPDVIFSMAHDASLAYPVSSSVSAASSNDAVCRISGDTLFGDGNFDGKICEVSDAPVIDHCKMEQNQHLGENNVVKEAEHLQFPGKDFMVKETVPAFVYDVSSKLPDDISSLFEISFTEEIPKVQDFDYTSREVQHVETISPEDLSFFYRDPQGDIQDAPEGTPFQSLGEVMPQLQQKPNFSEPSDALTSANSKFMVNDSLSSSHGGSVDASSRELMIGKLLSEREQFSELNICANVLPSQSQNLHDFAAADAEEVLYKGRRMNGDDKSLERFAAVDQGLAHVGQQFLAREIEQGRLNYQKNTSDNDMSALGLLWPELKVPIDNHSMGVETLYGHKQDFSSSGSHTFSHDAWPGAYSRSKRTNEAREAFDPGHFLHFHG
ncbi:hypothetical protein HPP92_028596 [Vanilla planifolia]|uniref:Uncharacterized protein n=1 Tax=Vanilla planifolia TaxID=51239 RepID=A0A835P7I7_VANPL|nr:hypothetical protein HPP92_028596 [Vanilla planifolia]